MNPFPQVFVDAKGLHGLKKWGDTFVEEKSIEGYEVERHLIWPPLSPGTAWCWRVPCYYTPVRDQREAWSPLDSHPFARVFPVTQRRIVRAAKVLQESLESYPSSSLHLLEHRGGPGSSSAPFQQDGRGQVRADLTKICVRRWVYLTVLLHCSCSGWDGKRGWGLNHGNICPNGS